MSSETQQDPVIELVNEFLDRVQRGEKPDIEEYCAEYPEFADQIRDVFPTLITMEDLHPATGDVEITQTARDFPDRIGDYRIIGEIGRGGMGVVYEAEQESLGRRVALKVLPNIVRSESASIRFQREARAAARMHHSNIVPVFDVGHEGDCFFYAMQFIQGQGLDAVIDELKQGRDGAGTTQLSQPTNMATGAVSEMSATSAVHQRLVTDISIGGQHFYRSVATIAAQTAGALAYAHLRGVIHRDIKPSNLMLDGEGIVWVTDFGLAKSDEEDATLTDTGDYLGTLRYMSPERFRGRCDARADIYALGMTLYELVLRRPAFISTDRLKLIYLINNTEAPRPKSIDSNVPQDLETIILKAIEKEPQARYQTAGDFEYDLQRFINDEPIRARRISTLEQMMRWARRNKGLATALSAIAALMCAFIVGLTFAVHREQGLREDAELSEVGATIARKDAERQRQVAVAALATTEAAKVEADQAREAADRSRVTAEEVSERMERSFYSSQMHLAGVALQEAFGMETVRARLADWAPEKLGKDLRGWEWYFMSALTDRPAFRSERLLVEGRFRGMTNVDHSPDGSRLVHPIDGLGFHVRDVRSGMVLKQQRVQNAMYTSWSPNGDKIAVGGIGPNGTARVTLWQADTLHHIRDVDAEHLQEARCVEWSPDSSMVAVCGPPKDSSEAVVSVHNAIDGQPLMPLKSSASWIDFLRFSNDGSRIAGVSRKGRGSVYVWDVASGNEIAKLTVSRPRQICWSHDDATLFVVAATSLRVWNLNSDTDERFQHSGVSVALRPEHNQLAVGRRSGTVDVWDLKTSQVVQTLHGHSTDVAGVSWSADGQYLAAVDTAQGRVCIWDMTSADQNRRLSVAEQGTINSIVWGPDGQRIAASSRDSDTLQVFRVNDGSLESSFKGAGPIRLFDFSPDGSQIVCSDQKGVVKIWFTDEQSVVTHEIAGWATCAAWHSNGHLAVGNRLGRDQHSSIRVFDAAGSLVREFQKVNLHGITAVDWNPNGDRIVCIGREDHVQVLDIPTDRIVWYRNRDQFTFRDVRWSQDGRFIATAHDGGLIVWDANSGDEVRRLDDVRESFRTIDWSPDGSRLLATSSSGLRMWDFQSATLTFQLRNQSTAAQFSPDGMRIANAGPELLRILDASPGYDEQRRQQRLTLRRESLQTVLAWMAQAKAEGRDDDGHDPREWNNKASYSFTLDNTDEVSRSIGDWLAYFEIPATDVNFKDDATRDTAWGINMAAVTKAISEITP